MIPKETTDEGTVFYKKMKGDYFRYLAEVKFEGSYENVVTSSKEAYEEAMEFAAKTLNAANPVRLGLALNFSVFYYEIENNPPKACLLAKTSFEEGMTELDNSDPETYKDSTLVMQLLRDNLAVSFSFF